MRTITLLVLLFTAGARADLRNDFGVGPRSVGTAGANRAFSDDGYAAMNSPALSNDGGNKRVSFGFFGVIARFEELRSIVVDNPYLGGAAVTYGNVDMKAPDALLFQAGFVTPLFNVNPRWKIGAVISTPLDKLVEVENRDWYRPSYVMYGTNSQRLSSSLALSYDIIDNLTLGIGGQMYIVQAVNLKSRLPQQPASTTTISAGTVARLGMAPTAGINWHLSDDVGLAINWMAARDSRLDFNLENYLYLLNNPSALTMDGGGRLYYDPETASLGMSVRAGSARFLGAVEYEKWSPYDGSILKVSFRTITSFAQLPESTAFKDIWVGRFGFDYAFEGGNHFRFGYAYRPTPVPTLSGPTNFLDSDRHIVGLGGGFNIGTIGGFFENPVTLDTGVQYHYLIPRDVVKSDPTYIGAPGYTVKGGVYSYAISLSKEM